MLPTYDLLRATACNTANAIARICLSRRPSVRPSVRQTSGSVKQVQAMRSPNLHCWLLGRL